VESAFSPAGEFTAYAIGPSGSPTAQTRHTDGAWLWFPHRHFCLDADLDATDARVDMESAKSARRLLQQDGGSWMEFTWKDTNATSSGEGVSRRQVPVEVSQIGDVLEFAGKGWKRRSHSTVCA